MWTCDDLKNKARLSLTGKYWWAVLWTLVFSLLTGMASSVVSFISTILFQILGFFASAVIGFDTNSAVPKTWLITGIPASIFFQIVLFVLMASAVMLFVYAMMFAIIIFIAAPLSLGYQKWFFDIREGGDGKKMDSLFMAFRKNVYGRMVKGMAWKTLWSLLWSLAALIPILVTIAIAVVFVIPKFYYIERGLYDIQNSEMIAWVILACVYTAGNLWYLIVMIRKYYSYQFTPYLLIDEPSLGYREILRKSIAMSRGQILHMLGLDLSFIGWWLLVILTCGYGALFLSPYPVAARTELYFARKAECKQT